VVPILYDGDPQWYGNLVSQDDGSFLKTNIPFHLEFIGKRKRAQETHFSQVARLVKFWTRKIKNEQDGFRFKRSWSTGSGASRRRRREPGRLSQALQHFFTYVAPRAISVSRIVFGDYYKPSTVGTITEPVQIIDPVNAANTGEPALTRLSRPTRSLTLPFDAGDAIDAALAAPDEARRRSITAESLLVHHFRCDNEHDIQLYASDSVSFTVTHARHMAAKVATDLKRMQRLYGAPSDPSIADYEGELIEL